MKIITNKRILLVVLVLLIVLVSGSTTAFAVSQAKVKNLPDKNKAYGTLTSNAWREGNGTPSGNTRQWDYQVSAVYSGKKTVKRIRSSWQGSASLRNAASISLGISNSAGSAGVSSSWQTVKTVAKYWENTNGAKTSSWSSNMIVTPKKDYRTSTISIINTALVKLSCDNRTFEINAGV
jgi:hypothetical protein